MKKYAIATCVIAVFASWSTRTQADTPTVIITAPTGIVTVGAFPYNASIGITLQHAPLSGLNVFDVRVNGESLFGDPVGNPFDGSNQCRATIHAVTSLCTTNSSDTANVMVPWQVGEAGSYNVTVVVRHSGDEGEDEEVVQFQLLSVEHTAPPALANAYINSSSALKSAYGKKRGCIVSEIAKQHGQNERYGDKPGPYNEALVHADVEYYGAICQ